MTRLEARQTLAAVVDEARAAGARLGPACALAGIDPRTAQRWQQATAWRAGNAGLTPITPRPNLPDRPASGPQRVWRPHRDRDQRNPPNAQACHPISMLGQ